MDELSVKCLLYPDDQVILAPWACGLHEMENKMNDSVKKKGIKVIFGKTKVMVFERGKSMTECDILIEACECEATPSRHAYSQHLREHCELKALCLGLIALDRNRARASTHS
ncbi:hypothetical protein EVAR_49709_1 [Eumeta japonica]|uniref:Reverse transcriptase domain-containing protein n=1 Tax=Eumeta variegata TaxID=151549 RepID=A0A4C1Z662_EUMVA|nr:hypothetical protein EVAR_49709_1 [Eumeta japonica]